MSNKHFNFIFPQWQGNTEPSPYYGAVELESLYLDGKVVGRSSVAEPGALALKNGITGYDVIVHQLAKAFALLDQENPDTIFTVGGGCDAGVVPISWLNSKYDGDISVVWLDAHADMNTPETSPSGMFCGMPMRTVLGEGDSAICDLLPLPLKSSQVLMGGVRLWDVPEAEFRLKNGIANITVEEMRQDAESLYEAVKDLGHSRVYIHLDIDVLDGKHYPQTPFAADGGLTCDELLAVLSPVFDRCKIAGFGLFEYAPVGKKLEFIRKLVEKGINLGAAHSCCKPA